MIKEEFFAIIGIDRLIKLFVVAGFKPNQITLISIFFGLLSVVFLFNNQVLFVCCYLTNRLLDLLDGYVARKSNLQTTWGDKLDHWGDLAIHACLLLKTAFHPSYELLAASALLVYLGEYLLLRRQNLLTKKFPTSAFGLFYTLGLFQVGLLCQIVYQVGSFLFFQLFLRKSASKK